MTKDELVEKVARAIMSERDGEPTLCPATEYDCDLARAALAIAMPAAFEMAAEVVNEWASRTFPAPEHEAIAIAQTIRAEGEKWK